MLAGLLFQYGAGNCERVYWEKSNSSESITFFSKIKIHRNEPYHLNSHWNNRFFPCKRVSAPILIEQQTGRIYINHLTSSSAYSKRRSDVMRTATEMIPKPEMIPISRHRSRNDPHGIKEWRLNMGRWIAFLFFVHM